MKRHALPVLLLSVAILLLLSFKLEQVSCENILFYGVVGSYSQRLSMWPLIKTLSDKGHNVTFMSPYDNKDPDPKVHDYAPKLWKESLGSWEDKFNFYNLRKSKATKTWFGIMDFGIRACQLLYSDPEFLVWVKSSKFDLIFVDGLMNECAYGLVHHYNSKLIMYGTTVPYGWYSDAHGIPDETSSVPDFLFNFPPGNEMSFFQRFLNALNPVVLTLYRRYWYFPQLEQVSRKGLGLEEISSFSEIEFNASLIMSTTHYSIDYPRSFPPNVVPVGGVVVGGDPKPLSKSLEDIVSKGKNGFIYISFGTATEFTNFEESVQNEFIKAISNYPNIQFVWKLTEGINKTLPDHIYVTKWAPQTSLLAHPKIKAFITHSGMGSTMESVQYGVPVVSLPVLTDQDMNAQIMAARGLGIKLEITTLKHHELEDAISEIINNPKYSLRMKTYSDIFKDRQTSALQDAVWWTEFILRHENTNEFLQPPSIQQPWWIRRQIDVWIFTFILLLALVSTPTYLVYLLGRKIISFSNGKKAKSD